MLTFEQAMEKAEKLLQASEQINSRDVADLMQRRADVYIRYADTILHHQFTNMRQESHDVWNEIRARRQWDKDD